MQKPVVKTIIFNKNHQFQNQNQLVTKTKTPLLFLHHHQQQQPRSVALVPIVHHHQQETIRNPKLLVCNAARSQHLSLENTVVVSRQLVFKKSENLNKINNKKNPIIFLNNNKNKMQTLVNVIHHNHLRNVIIFNKKINNHLQPQHHQQSTFSTTLIPSNTTKIGKAASIQPPRPSSRKQKSASSKTSTATAKKKSQHSVEQRNSSLNQESSIAATTPSSHTPNNNNNNTDNSTATLQISRSLFLHCALGTVVTDADLSIIASALTPMLADSTWYHRANLLNHLYEFLTLPRSRPELPLEIRICLFVLKERSHCQASTKLGYAKNFRAMAHAIGMLEHPTLNMLIKALSSLAASAPIRQAQLATEMQLASMSCRALLEDKNPALAHSIYLCTKTCSRWGDLVNLTKENFIINHQDLEENEILVLWGTKVKTSRFRPFKATGFTVVRMEKCPQQMVNMKEYIRNLKKNQKFCPKNTDQMLRWLKKKKETSNLTCHSFKRTGLDILAAAVVRGELQPTLLPLMAKHQDKNLQYIPESTIRYIANKVALAKILKTQEATKLI